MNEPTEDTVLLTTVPDEIEAAMIVAALEAEGIRAVHNGGYISGFKAEAPGEVRVLVQRAEQSQALAALQRIRAGEEPVDWSQVDVGEPE